MRAATKVASRRNRAPIGGHRAVGLACLVARRPDVGLLRALGGHPDRMVHRSRRDFVVVDQPGQHREAGRVGRGPAGRPQGVRVEVPDGTGAGRGTALRVEMGVPGLVEGAGRRVDHQRMAVRAAFDRRGPRQRVRAGIALTGIGERDRDQGGARRDDLPRDAIGLLRAGGRPEVGMERSGRRIHRGEPRRAPGVHREPGDRGVPHVVGREGRTRGAGEDRARGRRRDPGRHDQGTTAGHPGGECAQEYRHPHTSAHRPPVRVVLPA